MATARQESGEGTDFGYKVSAYLMARLASRGNYAGFCSRPISELHLQTSPMGVPYDDQMVVTKDDLKRQRHLLQCKIRILAQPSKKVFQDLLFRPYRALQDQNNALEDGDLFVMVCQECQKAEELSRVFSFAAGSLSIDDLRIKLKREGPKFEGMLQTLLATLSFSLAGEARDNAAELDLEVARKLFSRLRVWVCDLGRVGSLHRSSAIDSLIQFCQFDYRKAEMVLRKCEEFASVKERERTSFTWESLKSEFGGIDEPKQPEALETIVSVERIAELERIVGTILSDRQVRTYESYKELKKFLEAHGEMAAAAMGGKGEPSMSFLILYARCASVLGISLLKLLASRAKLQAWLQEYGPLAEHYPPFWTVQARIALEAKDKELYQLCYKKIEDESDLAFLRGLRFMADSKLDEAREELLQVNGDKRADALLNLAHIEVMEDSTEAGCRLAVEHLKQAELEFPDLVALKLAKQAYTVAAYFPNTSEMYLPDYSATESDSEDFRTCLDELEEIIASDLYGVYERMLAIQNRFRMLSLAPGVPVFLTDPRLEIIELAAIQGPEGKKDSANVLSMLAHDDDALKSLREAHAESEDGGDKEETAWTIRWKESPPTCLSEVPSFNLNTQVGVTQLRQYFIIPDAPEALKSEVVKALRAASYECAQRHEVLFCDAILREDMEVARNELDTLKKRYPYAAAVWWNLLYWLAEYANESRRVNQTADSPEGLLEICLEVAERSCTLWPISNYYAAWIEFAAREERPKVQELQRISDHAERSGDVWAQSVARALRSNARKEYAEAADDLDLAFENGGLSADLLVIRDQAKWYSRRLEDLAAGADELLKNQRRDPRQALLTVRALLELGRQDRALALAKRNFEDFPNSEVAHWDYVETTRKTGDDENFIRLLTSFSLMYPSSKAAWSADIDIDKERIVSAVEASRKHASSMNRLYSECTLPLILCDGQPANTYEWQCRFDSGLQAFRFAFGVHILEAKDFHRRLMVDYTALLTITKFGLWGIVEEAGLNLVVPDFLYNKIFADARVVAADHDHRIESRLDRIRALLESPRLKRPALGESEADIELANVSPLDTDHKLARQHDLTPVGHSFYGVRISDLLELGRKAGQIPPADYTRLAEDLAQRHWGDPTDRSEPFPKRIIVDGLALEALAHLPAPDLFFNCFEEVFVGPWAMTQLSMQFGQVDVRRDSRELIMRLVRELRKGRDGGTLEVIETETGVLEDIDFLREFVQAAAVQGLPVWCDDMATRRILSAESSPIASASSLEISGMLGEASRIGADQATNVILDLVDNGHRDPYWPNLAYWFLRSPAFGFAGAARYIGRLAWQISKGNAGPQEQAKYLHLLILNLLSSVQSSSGAFIELCIKAIENIGEVAPHLITYLFLFLRNQERDDAEDIAYQLASELEKSGHFNFEIFKYDHGKTGLATPLVANLSGRMKFNLWFRTSHKKISPTMQVRPSDSGGDQS